MITDDKIKSCKLLIGLEEHPLGCSSPPELIDVIRCQCRAQGKKCSTEACGCHKQHLSCTSYCNCSGGEDCCNPYTNRQVGQAGDEEGAEMEDIQAEDFEDGFDQDSDDAMDDLAIFDDLDEWE